MYDSIKRASQMNNERRIIIDEVNPSKLFVTGHDSYKKTYRVTFDFHDSTLAIPSQGEMWIVQQYNNEWRLTRRAETGMEKTKVTDLSAGDRRIEAQNNLYLNGNKILINGVSAEDFVFALFPSGDTTGVTDSQKIKEVLDKNQRVILRTGQWYVSTEITGSSKWLQGEGPATILSISAGETGLKLSNVEHFFLSDLTLVGGNKGIDIEGAADSHLWNLYFQDQKQNGIYINGDDSTEIHFNDIVMKNVDGIAFDYARTTNADMGGIYLDRVRIIQAPASATHAYRFRSTSGTPPNINLFMSECVGDNYPNSSLYIENCNSGIITTSWFTCSSLAGSGKGCIHISDSALYSFSNSHTVQASSSGSSFGILLTNGSGQIVISGHTFAFDVNTALGLNDAGNDIVLGSYYSSQPTLVDTPSKLSNVTVASGPRIFYTNGAAGAGQSIGIIDSNSPGSAAKYIRNAGGAFQILNGAFSSALFALADNGKITTPLLTTNSTIDDGSGNLTTGGSVQAGGAGIKLYNNGTFQFLNSGGAALLSGTGVPGGGLGSDGDFYFRKDGTSGSALYHKASGSWSALA